MTFPAVRLRVLSTYDLPINIVLLSVLTQFNVFLYFYLTVLFAIDQPTFCIESSKTLLHYTLHTWNNLPTLLSLLTAH